MKVYAEGYELAENEYMLKIHDGVGFMTKYNKNGSIPKAFDEWKVYYYEDPNLTINVIEETFRSGWKIVDYRHGKSQNWCKVKHPLGFVLEIYIENIFTLIADNIIKNGILVGEFKWEYSKLVKNEGI